MSLISKLNYESLQNKQILLTRLSTSFDSVLENLTESPTNFYCNKSNFNLIENELDKFFIQFQNIMDKNSLLAKVKVKRETINKFSNSANELTSKKAYKSKKQQKTYNLW